MRLKTLCEDKVWDELCFEIDRRFTELAVQMIFNTRDSDPTHLRMAKTITAKIFDDIKRENTEVRELNPLNPAR